MVFCLAPEELASRRVFGRFSFSQEQASHHVGGYATQDGLKQAQEPFEFNYQLDRHCSKTVHRAGRQGAIAAGAAPDTSARPAILSRCRERGSTMYLALGAYGLAILIPFLLYVVGRVIVEIYLAIWRWRHM